MTKSTYRTFAELLGVRADAPLADMPEVLASVDHRLRNGLALLIEQVIARACAADEYGEALLGTEDTASCGHAADEPHSVAPRAASPVALPDADAIAAMTARLRASDAGGRAQ